jgi:crossover junction endodeoxyribonuclease RusA
MSYPNSIQFFVPGIPVAKGSAKAFYNKRTGRAMITQSNLAKQKPWASMISHEAILSGVKMSEAGPVHVRMTFAFHRPKKHYRGKAMEKRDDAPNMHTVKPDVDKLVRCVFDALTGIAWRDDSQAQIQGAMKMYVERGEQTGAIITIRGEQ